MIKFLFCISLLSFLLTGCYDKKTIMQKKLKLSLSSEIPSLDPSVSYDQVSQTVVAQVYEQLYQFNYYIRPYIIEPLIAENLPKYSADKKVLTITLKKDIPYHTHPLIPAKRFVTAQDFINAFKRLAFIPTQSPGFWLIDGLISGINEWRNTVGSDIDKMIATTPKGLKAINNHTLQITLNYPSSQLLFALTMPFTAPCPSELIKKLQVEPITTPDYGTGAYFIESYRAGNQITLKQFPAYKSSVFPNEGISATQANTKLPLIQEIEFSIIKESNSRWLKFLAQETHIENVPKDYFPKVFDESLKIKNDFADKPWISFLIPTLTLWWIGFNMNDPVVGSDINLRLAIAHAIDTAKYRKIFTSDLAQPMISIIPPLIAGHTAFTQNFDYNVELAKNYFKKSKFANSKAKKILKFSVRSNDSVGRQMAEFFQMELKTIGLEISIDAMPFQAFLEAQRKGQLQFFVDGWAMDYPHPANMVQLLSKKNFSPGPNHTYYKNDKVEQVYDQLLEPIEDEKTLQGLIDTVQQQLLKDVPWIPLMQSRGAAIINNKIKNFNPSPVIQNNYKYLDLEI
jgi:oligopeptide transport system substrate-binding protein